jgi:uncharacterized protein (DUF1697 family)
MGDLRSLFETLGYTDVRTYIQSGNVLFTTKRGITAKKIEDAIKKRFDLDVDVALRTGADLRRAVERNPFPKSEADKVHVGFMTKAPTTAVVSGLDRDKFLPETFEVVGSELYLYLPDGLGRSKLPTYAVRAVKVPTTVRNWKTVTKLVELAA